MSDESKPASKPLTPEQKAAFDRAVAAQAAKNATPAIDATPKSPLAMAAAAASAVPAATEPAATGAAPPKPDPKVKAPTPAATAAKPAAKNVALPSTAKQRSSAATAPQGTLLGQGSNSGATNPFADMLTKAAELGTAAGKGKNTQIQFHLMVLDAAYNGTIDLTTNKHGPDRDDALILSEAYVRAQNTATIFDPKAPNQRKATSLVRTCIKLGHYRPIKGNHAPGEPVRSVNALMSEWRTARNKAAQNPKHSKKLQDATNTLMSFARAQLKDDRLIPESKFPDFIYRKDRDLPDAAELLARSRDALEALIKGTAAESTARDDSDEVKNAHQWLTVRLAKIAEEAAAQNAPQPAAPAKSSP